MADSLNEFHCLSELPFFSVENVTELFDSDDNYVTMNNGINEKLNLFECDNVDNATPLTDLDPDRNVNSYKDNVSNILNLCNYYSDDDFVKISSKFEKNCFSLYHINIRSLAAHNTEFLLSQRNTKSNFKVIGMCETWLSDFNCHLFCLPNYKAVHKTRANRRGGGVSLYIHESIDFKTRDDLSLMFNDVVESVFIEIEKSVFCTTNNIILGEIYRPPKTSVFEFNDCLEQLLVKMSRSNALCYLMGDFNINLLNSSTHEQSGDFLNTLLSYSFVPLISRPTRCTSSNATLIDNIFTNSLKSLSENSLSGISFQHISDHFPVFLFNNFKTNIFNKNQIIFKESFNPQNINRFKDFLINHNWNTVVECNDVNHATNTFLNQVSHFYKVCFPVKKIVLKSIHKPWVTHCLLNSIKRKNKLYKAHLKNPCSATKLRFSKYRNKLNHLLRISEKKYYTDCLKKHAQNLRKSWNIINEILDRSKSTDSLPESFESHCGNITGPKNIANHFNQYFSTIGTELADNIRPTSVDPLHYISPSQSNNLTLDDIDEEDLKKIFLTLKNSAAGYDGIRPSVLKSVFDQIKMPLIYLVNMSFHHGIFPDRLKQAVITPIHKQGNRKIAGNYRPISVLSVKAYV